MERGHVDVAARIANGIWWFWGARSHSDVALTYLRPLLRHPDQLAPDLQVGLLTGAAYIEHEGGDIPASLPAGERAVELARESGDDRALSLALIYWANTAALNFGRWQEAQAGYTEGYELAERAGDDWAMGWHALNHGWINRFRNRPEEAERFLRVARDHFRDAEIPLGLAWATTGLGLAMALSDQNESAEDLLREAIAMQTQLGNKGAVMFGHVVLARLLDTQNRLDEALEEVEQGLIINHEIVKNIELHPVAARVFRRRGDLNQAADHLEKSLDEGPFIGRTAIEFAELAAVTDLPEVAAPLFVYATDEYVRDGTVPTKAVSEDWHRLRAALDRTVEDWEPIEAQWAAKTPDEMHPIAVEALAEIRAALKKGPDGI